LLGPKRGAGARCEAHLILEAMAFEQKLAAERTNQRPRSANNPHPGDQLFSACANNLDYF